MSKTGKRRWAIGIVVVLVIGAVVAGFSYRQSSFASDPKSSSADDLDLRIGKTETGDVQIAVSEVGTIEPVIKVDVKSTLSGTIKQILVREGDRVTAGRTLARVEPDVNQAKTLSAVKSEVTVTEIDVEKARKDLESNKALFDEGYLAEQQVRDAQQHFDTAMERFNQARTEYKIVVDSGIPLDQTISTGRSVNVDAPMDGYVIKKNVEVGQTVMSGVSSFNEGTSLFTVADLSAMLIKASVNEVEIGRIRLAQPVDITVDAFPYRHFSGSVTHISPAARLKDKVKVFDIEVTLAEQNTDFRAGMTANIEIKGDRVEKVMTAPVESIFKKDGGEIVYVLKKTFDTPGSGDKPAKKNKNGKIEVSEIWQRYFEQRKVKVGLTSLEKVQVVEGLAEGEQLALEDPTKPRMISED
ncbi:MAG TPA: efflux RND transporter periplasmic adaptor subunit [Candidatus Polarisedimenticolia bacterium]|nr:efflux RND transporter periplasmic adaptor subunit [Candidatus Polarisedimenticolia bacterium]